MHTADPRRPHVHLLGLDWSDQDVKDMTRSVLAAIIGALVVAYVLRRTLGLKV